MFIGNANILGRRTNGSIVYLLDTYSAVAAYSLRQLKTGVTSVVRVRRSSDNAESDFTADEITDGTLTTWVGANNGFVTKLYEQSGSGKGDLINTVAGQQPKLVNAGTVYTDTNGLPYIVFDAIDDDLQVNSLITASTQHLWAFHVTHSTNYSITKDTGALTWGWRIVSSSGSVDDRHSSINSSTEYSSTAAATTTGQKLITAEYEKGVTTKVYVDGVGATAATPANSDLRTTTGLVEINRTPGGAALGMEFQEFILFETDQSANQTAIETEISTHYTL